MSTQPRAKMVKSRIVFEPLPDRQKRTETAEDKQREKLLKFFAMLDPARQQIVVDLAVSLKRDLDRARRLRLPPAKLRSPVTKGKRQ